MEIAAVAKIKLDNISGEIEVFPGEDGKWSMTIYGKATMILVMGDGTEAFVETGPGDTTIVDVDGHDVKITQA